jgi:hypothetical protein
MKHSLSPIFGAVSVAAALFLSSSSARANDSGADVSVASDSAVSDAAQRDSASHDATASDGSSSCVPLNSACTPGAVCCNSAICLSATSTCGFATGECQTAGMTCSGPSDCCSGVCPAGTCVGNASDDAGSGSGSGKPSGKPDAGKQGGAKDAASDASHSVCIMTGIECTAADKCCDDGAYCGDFNSAGASTVCGLDQPNSLPTNSCAVGGRSGVDAVVLFGVVGVVVFGRRRRRQRSA